MIKMVSSNKKKISRMKAEMVSSLKNEDGSINIPGFYDDVEIVSAEEREKA